MGNVHVLANLKGLVIRNNGITNIPELIEQLRTMVSEEAVEEKELIITEEVSSELITFLETIRKEIMKKANYIVLLSEKISDLEQEIEDLEEDIDNYQDTVKELEAENQSYEEELAELR